jgi:hypothetical protein
MAVGFYIHRDMNFIVTERRTDGEKVAAEVAPDFQLDAGSL